MFEAYWGYNMGCNEHKLFKIISFDMQMQFWMSISLENEEMMF